MISKKVLFPLAAVAMASFVACGDDSSSGSPSSDAAPASIQKFEEIDDVACSQSANLGAKVYLVEHNDTLQCNGTQWNTMINGQPVAGCENATPETQTPSTENPPVDNPPVDNPPVDNPPASGNMVSCDIPGVMGECLEFPAGSAEATAMEAQCVSVMMGTLGTGCAK